MRIIITFTLTLIFSLTIYALPPWLKVSNIDEIPPEPDIKEVWMNDIFETEELWVINNKKYFFQLLEDVGIAPKLKADLEASFKFNLPGNVIGQAGTFYPLNNYHKDGYIILSEALKKELPPQVLRTVYSHLYQTNFGPPSYTADTIEELKEEVHSWEMKPEVEKQILETIIPLEGRYGFPFTRDIWPDLPQLLKLRFLDAYTKPITLENQAISVNIHITSDTNLREIAETFAGESNPVIIERYLRMSLSANGGNPTSIPLQAILPHFIRKAVNKYHTYGGPNCFNCGLNVNQSRKFKQEFIDENDLRNTLAKDYILLSEGDKLRTGDLLLYKNDFGSFIHVNTYITEGIVFTKNGINKFAPYIFQNRELNEKKYFTQNDFQLEVYRIKKTSSLLLDSSNTTTSDHNLTSTIQCMDFLKSFQNVQVSNH